MLIESSEILSSCKAALLRRLKVAGRTMLHLDSPVVSGPPVFNRGPGDQARHLDVRDGDVERAEDGWIGRDRDGRFDAAAGTVDIIWADQGLERLWPEQIVVFLSEARRLLSAGGVLILAGTNREVAGPAPRPARPVELTWAEAVALVQAAGFDITRPKGLLLARGPDGEPLEAVSDPSSAVFDMVTRAVAGADAPERSLVWWAEVRPSDRAVDVEHMDVLLQRAAAATARNSLALTDVSAASLPEGTVRVGRRLPLRAGRYRATVHVQRSGKASAPSSGVIEARVGSDEVVAQAQVDASSVGSRAWVPVHLEFELERPVDNFDVLFTPSGAGDIRVRPELDVASIFWKPMQAALA
ncbi:hypothetical protein [Brevundimonas subvibrioides]|uniref:Methyltransferase type 11 domain-containing protein n=1 Tax=Brevundimonas subvibrioides (strain ATCC 15264 / DSM 4735 / LMG 14903 / NBRC 16000 / CB 81) TaxID=633149 RepID=D9QG48_BRESC|nr:hypothetical protein [Brevundimonas subvibrioides]ADL02590.1 hypothetical protein Bresu_3284 [Brevundimonas subvibrioides ATCC 15264]